MTINEEPENGRLSVHDVTSLVNMFAGLLDRMEKRLVEKMDDNSEMARERWAKHDQELERNREAITCRFVKVETMLDQTVKVLTDHLTKERDEDLVIAARVRPIKTVVGFLWANWRTIVLIVLGILTIVGWGLDVVNGVRP